MRARGTRSDVFEAFADELRINKVVVPASLEPFNQYCGMCDLERLDALEAKIRYEIELVQEESSSSFLQELAKLRRMLKCIQDHKDCVDPVVCRMETVLSAFPVIHKEEAGNVENEEEEKKQMVEPISE